MRQNRDIWLAEFKRQLKHADPLLAAIVQPTNTRVDIAGSEVWGIRLVTASREENAAGFHQENLTVVAEESSGIPRGIITTFKGTLTNRNALFLMIGNPNTRDCAFFDCFHSQRADWYCITLNAEETPHSIWFDPERNSRVEREFGLNSTPYRVRVQGQFPNADPDTIMASEDLEGCTVTDARALRLLKHPGMRQDDPDDPFAYQIGLDFARFGQDENVIFLRVGGAVEEWKAFQQIDPNQLIDYAFKAQAQLGWKDDQVVYCVDAGGMGQGLLRRFYDAKKRLLPFNNGAAATDRQYGNRITEAWFQLAAKVRERKVRIPNDSQLVQQLSNRRYHLNAQGKLLVEAKDDYRDRVRKADPEAGSPDRAEALIYAMYDGHSGLLHSTLDSERDARRGGRRIGMRVDP
jgi:hypothetical protein